MTHDPPPGECELDEFPAHHRLTLLLIDHVSELSRSGITVEHARANGVYSTQDDAEVARLLRRDRSPTDGKWYLVFPYPQPDGSPSGYARVKPLYPRNEQRRDGSVRAVKYEGPVATRNHPYLLPLARRHSHDPAVPLVLTEGEKKGLCLNGQDIPTIGLAGVWGWCLKRESPDAERRLLPELEGITWAGRRVTILFDSDMRDNPNVTAASRALAGVLAARGAEVLAVYPPPGPAGGKVGADDFFAEHGRQALVDLLAAAQPLAPPASTSGRGRRPDVEVRTDEHLTNAEAAAALATHANLFQRGDALVRVLELDAAPRPTDAIRRPIGTPTIRTVDKHTLRDALSSVARFVRAAPTPLGTVFVPSHPPGWCVDACLHRGDWPGVRPLDAVVPHPLVLPDGRIAARSGYEPAAAALVHMPPGVRVEVPDEPTFGAVRAAVDTLADVYVDFPFVTPAHRSAMLAALLTPLAWALYDGPSPLFLIDGNVRGVGKGLLANTLGEVVLGQPLAVMNYTDDLTELAKHITSIAISGDRLVLLDNLNGSVGNSVLDAMLTTTRWRGRILGESREYHGPLRAVWLATGNNTSLRADTARRTLHIRLQSPEERPETRGGFRHPDLLKHVRAARGRLLSAALTILRGWVRAGRPTHGLTAWGSYEGWSGVVREAVVYAGLPDPGSTREAMTAESDEAVCLMGAVIAGMERLDPDRQGLTTSEMVERMAEKHPPAWLGELKEAVSMLCGRVDARSLGYKLRHYKMRNFGGRMVVQSGGTHNNVKRWVIRTVGPESRDSDGGDGGHGGHERRPKEAAPDFPPAGGIAPITTITPKEGPNRAAPPAQPAAVSPAVWDDDEAFFMAMKSAGLAWPQVLVWLNDRHLAALPPTTGFFDVPAAHRQTAYEHLCRRAQAA